MGMSTRKEKKPGSLNTNGILGTIARNAFRTRIERLILFVTNRCPLDCAHCFVDKTDRGEDELTVGEAAAIAGTVGPLTWLDIGGGEPFLRDDLVELCRQFRTTETDIPTSGWLVDRTLAAAREFAESVPGRAGVSVSLDGFRETHDRLRQSGSFDRAMETLEGLQRIPGLRVSVISTVSRANWEELPEFVRSMRGQGLAGHNINIMRGKPADPDLGLPDEAQLRTFRSELLKALGPAGYAWQGMFSRLVSRLHYRYVERKWDIALKVLATREQVVPCLAGKADLVVYANGDVAPCELLPAAGNIRDEPLDSILAGQQWLSALEAIRAKQCFCTHECNMLDSTLLNLRTFARVMLSPGERR